MTLSQSNRPGSLTTPLGEDAIVLKSFTGIEAMGELFEFHIEAVSETENVNFDQAIGQACTISLKTYQGKTRYFCGILTHAQWTGKDYDIFSYRLVLRPWLWLLAHRATCQIFLEKSVTDIIQKVFQDAGFSSGNDFDLRTTGNYATIPYCVQYRETDLAFVCRLMEQYGIYYFFEHSAGKHKMVLADSKSSHSTIADLPTVNLNPQVTGYNRQEQYVDDWTSDRRFRTGEIKLNDYDYLNSNKNLVTEKDGQEKYSRSNYEVYDYPGKYVDTDVGTHFAQYRLEAEQALDHRRLADGDAPSIYPGGLITLAKHPTGSENQEYQVVRSSHSFGTQQYAATTSSTPSYSGSYEFLPSAQQFRMLPLTPKPRIYGIQTAKVVAQQGEAGEEISTDKNGHIWVNFFWDLQKQNSCPIRVAQVWSGQTWGGQFLPRIGMEVVVEFLEGDPDRPLVTGCVYNDVNMYPYSLPGNKTQSGLYSNSSKGGGGYNEIMFEDLKGSEFIRMHAQKDHLVTILNQETTDIGEKFTPSRGSASRTHTLKNGDDVLTVKQGDQNITISQGDQTVKISTGQQTINVMQDIMVTSTTKITLQVGSSTIVIDPTSISLKSLMINIEAEAQLSEKAPMIEESADAMMTIKGGIVMIN